MLSFISNPASEHRSPPSYEQITAPPGRIVELAAHRLELLAVVALGFSFADAATLGAAGTAPMFTSAPAVTFPQSYFGTFTITTSGNPVPTITQTGHLPGGVKFSDNGDGTATLSGRPGNGLGLIRRLRSTLKASNGIGTDATQSFNPNHESAEDRQCKQRHFRRRPIEYLCHQGREDVPNRP